MGLRTHLYLVDRGALVSALDGLVPTEELVERAVEGWCRHRRADPVAVEKVRAEFDRIAHQHLAILRDGGTPVHRGEVDPYSEEAAQDEELTYKLESFLESLCLGYCKELLLDEHSFELYWDLVKEPEANGITPDVAEFLQKMVGGRHPNGDAMVLVEACFGFLFPDEAVEVFLATRHNPKMRPTLKKGWDEKILQSMNRKLQEGDAFFFWSCD